MRELAVYGWKGMRPKVGQTREVMAAYSKAEVARALNVRSASQIFNLARTGNPSEVAIATASPNQVFWHPLYELPISWRHSDGHLLASVTDSADLSRP